MIRIPILAKWRTERSLCRQLIIYHHPTSAASFPNEVQVQIHGVFLSFMHSSLPQRQTDMYICTLRKKRKKQSCIKIQWNAAYPKVCTIPCSFQPNPESLEFNMFEGSRCWFRQPGITVLLPGTRKTPDQGKKPRRRPFFFLSSFPIFAIGSLHGATRLIYFLARCLTRRSESAKLTCDLNLHLSSQGEKGRKERKKTAVIHRLMNSPSWSISATFTTPDFLDSCRPVVLILF